MDGRSPIGGPFAALHGGAFVGPAIPESPDPLANYRWEKAGATEGLQQYLLHPVATSTDPGGSFLSLAPTTQTDGQILVKGPGSVRFDFGVESAAWLEFDSPDLSGKVEMSIS